MRFDEGSWGSKAKLCRKKIEVLKDRRSRTWSITQAEISSVSGGLPSEELTLEKNAESLWCQGDSAFFESLVSGKQGFAFKKPLFQSGRWSAKMSQFQKSQQSGPLFLGKFLGLLDELIFTEL
jgi:hypothetical protein